MSDGHRSRPSVIRQRTLQKVGDAQRRRVLSQIGSIEMFALHANNPEDVAPLTIGRLSAFPIPAQLLQQDIFGRMYVERLARTYCNRLAAVQLLLVERRAAQRRRCVPSVASHDE
jgi:hypothetical protein